MIPAIVNGSIVNIIREIEDNELAKLRYTADSNETFCLDCIYKESDSPSFFLVFPPATIPDSIALNDNCSVLINKEQSPIVVSARIEARRGERTLELAAIEMIDPASLREYFRVFYRAPITASHRPLDSPLHLDVWDMQGTIVDLSASGVLAIFPEEFGQKKDISLQFHLNGVDKSIHCLAHVVRIRLIRKSRIQIALSFDEISRIDQDAIVTECMMEQRKQLRNQVKE
jgi:c-di-GMP-binding flagellar brake protein YcgR